MSKDGIRLNRTPSMSSDSAATGFLFSPFPKSQPVYFSVTKLSDRVISWSAGDFL
ncbi:hypothetical protein HanXRQr2_Chr15g0704301 [Helianthus annuus]|uniref:Uncharacterized protein n=1 Tax=Helianthus annuus TaxID=4232 RepID=A0A9K3E3Q5_HELAN|nr:hypothetical protein HanXRQr2_Chr15g0704301 [Helianthus annuus]KAJ0832190.1 hypothetical protein HanPSC8_Chr15g0675891 [Helianthus annuus]